MNRLSRLMFLPVVALPIFWSAIGTAQEGINDRTKVSSDERKGFPRRLERVLLELGLSADVFVYEGKLTIFMPINKALVFKLITKGDLLKKSYDLGYKGLTFMPHYGQTYIFDFSKGLPRCDVTRQLCV